MAFLKVAMLKLLLNLMLLLLRKKLCQFKGSLLCRHMTLDLRLNPASFRRHINTSTDVRTGRQVDVGYWLYDVVTKIQPISDVKLTSDACWGRVFHICRQS